MNKITLALAIICVFFVAANAESLDKKGKDIDETDNPQEATPLLVKKGHYVYGIEPSCAGRGSTQGRDGKDGRDGRDGIPGRDGLTGAQGSPGARGEAGTRGMPGQKGESGEKGSQGKTGDRGSAGPQGPAGPKGEPGNGGSATGNGEKGDKGERGDKGTCPADACTSRSTGNDSKEVIELREEIARMKNEILHPFCSSMDNDDDLCGELCSCADAPNKQRYVCDCTRQQPRFDCTEHAKHSNISGLYKLKILQKVVKVYCDMGTDGGGWTVVQRRQDGSQDFYKRWQAYRNGFGDVRDEYWFGLQNIYLLTTNHNNKVRFDMRTVDDKEYYAEYSAFKITDESDFYKLTSHGAYTGNAGQSLSLNLNYKFSTWDKDNDGWSGNCALLNRGAFWYRPNGAQGYCFETNINGEYHRTGKVGTKYGTGIHWKEVTKNTGSLKYVDMKIKRTTH